VKQANPYAPERSREVVKFGATTIVKNKGPRQRRLMIGVPTLGVVRIEWDVHRRGTVIPINWSVGEVTANHMQDTIGMGYHTADAQNVCMERAYLDKYEWLLLYEDDVLPPFDSFLKLSVHMEKMETPIISGLYYSKSEPCWPLVFRGRGNGAYRNFKTGDKVWCDGVPTGYLLMHSSIFRYLWEHSPDYRLPDGKKIKQVFRFPRESWWDPEQDRYFSQMGTSDLALCDRIMRENIFAKAGWKDLAKKKYPFLCDTGIYAQQIDLTGKLYPANCREILAPLGDIEAAFPEKKRKTA
jgi:hypothetical protein